MRRNTGPGKAKRAPKSIQDVLDNVARRAPDMRGPLDDRLTDGRPLAAAEKERLFGLLGADHDEETRCAAAYIIAKLGITSEAGTLLKSAYLTSKAGSNLRFTLAFTELCSGIMAELGTAPPRVDQLEMLAEMMESPLDGERRFADLVIRKAGIKLEGSISW